MPEVVVGPRRGRRAPLGPGRRRRRGDRHRLGRAGDRLPPGGRRPGGVRDRLRRRNPPRALGEPFAHALENVGLQVSDIVLAAVSHFHIDHTGGMPLLAAAGVPIAVQRKELDFALETRTSRRPTTATTTPTTKSNGGSSTGTPRSLPASRPSSRPVTRPGICPTASSCPRPARGCSPSRRCRPGQNLFDSVPIGWTARPEDVARAPDRCSACATSPSASVPGSSRPRPVVLARGHHPPGGHR